jgi:hypothetical protein
MIIMRVFIQNGNYDLNYPKWLLGQ